MQELFDLSFSPANIFPTILLLFVALYWLVFLFGMLDLSFMDFDLETDAGVDVDMDVDADIGMDKNVHVESGSELGKDLSGQAASPGMGTQILHFLNLGDIPFMLYFSFFALFFWALSILSNRYLSEGNLLYMIGFGVGALVLSLLLAKLITQPFRKLFRELGKGDVPIDFRGKLCTLELGMDKKRLGQANVNVNGNHYLVSVRSEGGVRLPAGTSCLIVDRDPIDQIYTVQAFKLEDEAL